MKRFLATITLVLFAATAFAQPAPSPRLGDLQSFAGTWTCTGKAFQSPWGPEHPTTATIRVIWDPGRYWLHAAYAEQKTARNPHPASGHVFWGYDEASKKFIGYAVNNFGGHETIESDGWKGETIVWTGTMQGAGASIPTRDTFTRKSAREVTHLTEAELGGKWMPLDGETCRKK
jgi:hypothetical protein